MNFKHLGLFGAGAVMLLASLLGPALTNTIVMPGTSTISMKEMPAGPDDIKPDECGPVTPVEIVTGSGDFNGTDAAELILSEGGSNIINGGGGDDCIVSGEGLDEITGGDGYDVCIGSADTVSFATCEEQYPAP